MTDLFSMWFRLFYIILPSLELQYFGLAGCEQKQSTKIAPQIAHEKCKMSETKPFLFLYSDTQFNSVMNNTVIFFNRQNGSVLIYQSPQASSKCVA